MIVTEHHAERITRYLDVRTVVPEEADVIFVFGSRHAKPAHMAADLMLRGVGRLVVLTGGDEPAHRRS